MFQVFAGRRVAAVPDSTRCPKFGSSLRATCRDAQNIANMIVRTGEDSPQERYWQDAAASITTGMILHVCYAAALEGRVACLADLAHVFTNAGLELPGHA